MAVYGGRALIMTAILTQQESTHSGSFSKRRSIQYIEKLNNSPLFCDVKVTAQNTELIVLTDDALLRQKDFDRVKIVFLRLQTTSIIVQHLRFLVTERYLQARDDWTHAYMIDSSDVVIFRRPPLDGTQLAVGVDTAKKWIRNLMLAQNYSLSASMRHMLQNKSAVMFNAGIIGGSRLEMLAFLKDFRKRSSSHIKVNDMILVNEYFLHVRVPLTLGYPHGPVHLPFWGTPIGCWNVTCRHAFLRQSRGYYWFGHKIPGTWVHLLRTEHFCAPKNQTHSVRSDAQEK